MFSFLKTVVASLQKSSHGRPSACGVRRASLRLESLEDRQLLSASPLVMSVDLYAATVQTQTQVDQTYPSITPVGSDRVFETPFIPSYSPDSGAGTVYYPDVPVYYRAVNDFQNVSFNMQSENGTSHQLTIQTQDFSLAGSGTFTGVWDGLKSNGGEAVSGSLTARGGNTDIKFTWGDHTFMGTISGDPGSYHIEGTVYVYGDQFAPGFTVGDQVLPDLTGMKWKMPEGGHNYSIQIVSQNNLPDGTATFTGTWSDHAAVTGTLRYEADGSISISFSWGATNDHLFEGTISGDPSHNDIDGTVTVDGNSGGLGHLYGSRVR